MKRTLTIGVMTITVFLSAALLAASHVQAAPEGGEAKVSTLKSRCSEIKSTLVQLEVSDKLLRHNIGSTFLTVSNKLMTPLNQRIASNQLDGSILVGITAEYTQKYKGGSEDSFYEAYLAYENSLLTAIEINCLKQPEEFIELLKETRAKRLKLRAATVQLMGLAHEYEQAFDAFAAKQRIKGTEVR